MYSNPFVLILVGLLGVFFQIIMKVRQLRRTTKDLVIDISVSKYLHDEWDNLMGNIIVLVIVAVMYHWKISSLTVAERAAASGIYGFISEWNVPIFIITGYVGADLLSHLFSVTQVRINEEISKIAKQASDATADCKPS